MANLTQLKMLESLDGYVLVDKPSGIAFSTVVKSVKRKFNLIKVGHGGSLDALASGLFVLLIGDANRFAEDVMSCDRSYRGTFILGRRTSTHDIYGETIEVPPSQAKDISAVLPEFKGDVFQTEPRFCSVRREGSAGYEIADTGEHGMFLAHVYRIDVGETDRADVRSFSLCATKGVLVRTLINDIGEAMGCGACLETLRRIGVGRLSVENAIGFDKLLELEAPDFISLVRPFSKALL